MVKSFRYRLRFLAEEDPPVHKEQIMKDFMNSLQEKWTAFVKRFATDEAFKKKTCIAVVAAVLLILVIILLCLLPGKAPEAPEEEVVPPVEETTEPEEEEVEVEPVVEPEGMKELMAKYEDVYAWLEIPGTGAVEKDTGIPYHRQEDAQGNVAAADLSLPILSHEQRDYYLYRKYDGTESKKGSLFTDSWVEGKFCNGTDMNDPVTVIYGHNQANREMLGGMMSYAMDLDFTKDEPPLMYVYQEGRRLTYRIFAGLQYDKCHILYNFDGLRDEETFNYFFTTEMYQFAGGIINVDENNKPVFGDRVVILSVCKDGDTEHRNRNLIMGILVEDTDVTTLADMPPAAQKWAKANADAKTDAKTKPAA